MSEQLSAEETARLAEAWDQGWRKGQQYSNDAALRVLLNPYHADLSVTEPVT